jgi:hypothetical protein
MPVYRPPIARGVLEFDGVMGLKICMKIKVQSMVQKA